VRGAALSRVFSGRGKDFLGARGRAPAQTGAELRGGAQRRSSGRSTGCCAGVGCSGYLRGYRVLVTGLGGRTRLCFRSPPAGGRRTTRNSGRLRAVSRIPDFPHPTARRYAAWGLRVDSGLAAQGTLGVRRSMSRLTRCRKRFKSRQRIGCPRVSRPDLSPPVSDSLPPRKPHAPPYPPSPTSGESVDSTPTEKLDGFFWSNCYNLL
jgi:hypothetical protein